VTEAEFQAAVLRVKQRQGEDPRLTIKRMRIAELEEENEKLRDRVRSQGTTILTLHADLREARAQLELVPKP
jgi:hypothetical protein